MKAILNFFWILTAMLVAACNAPTGMDPTKSASLTVRATDQPKPVNSGGRTSSTTSSDISITSVQITIADIRIEENSGNDNEQEGDFDDEDDQDENNVEGPDNEGPGSDITLAGPYVVELNNNLAVISEFQVFPGVYKKVNFKFVNGADDAIQISGSFTNTGTTTPFTLSSSFNQSVQVLLANGGVTVAANSTKDLDIVFDIDNWLAALDLSTATITNGEILINKTNNPALLRAFEAVLLQYIEAED